MAWGFLEGRALVCIQLVLFGILASFLFNLSDVESAFATSFVLNNSVTCSNILNGSWDATTLTCTNSNIGFTVSAGDTLNIPSGVTLYNPAGRTFSTGPGGLINNFGIISNSGTIQNFGSIQKHCGGVINNSGTLTGNTITTIPCPDLDGDGFPSDVDCNDGNSSINSAALEVFDGIDNDCDGLIDEGYTDSDSDGFAQEIDDCNDADSSINPTGIEQDNGIDDNCNGQTDEGFDPDGDGISNSSDNCDLVSNSDQADLDGDGLGDACDQDDDNDGVFDSSDECPLVAGIANGCLDADGDGIGDPFDNCSQPNPGQEDSNGDSIGDACQDQDSDSVLDPFDQCPTIPGSLNGCPDADGDNSSVNVDCDDSDSRIFPGAPELDDGKDNDCNGIVDDGLDTDSDGFTPIFGGDCNDSDSTLNPLAAEIPDGIDNNCDGVVLPEESDDDSDGVSELQGDCDDTNNTIFPNAVEITNDGIDQDCNGQDWITSSNIILNADKDSFLRKGAKNTNEGANTILMVQKAGNKRTLVSFDLSPYEDQQVTKATLKLYVTYNGGNWGKHNDRMIESHKLLSGWTEGNGANFVPKNLDDDDEPEKNKGTGSGVTWSCSTDTNISNKKTDCNPKWDGASFSGIITDSEIITSTTFGWIEFDVTSDVNAYLDGNTANNFGWLIKKSSESNSGRLAFASSENAVLENRPQLVLEGAHPPTTQPPGF